MIRARRLFSGLHGVTFNTMANLFIIVNSDRYRFGALANRFCSGNPKVVNAGVDRFEKILEAIESCYRVVINGRPTSRPSALRGSAPRSDLTPVPVPKADRPKTPAPPAGTKKTYPPIHPKWD